MAAYGEGVVLFGGYGNTVHSLNDTWTWTPEVTDAPEQPARCCGVLQTN